MDNIGLALNIIQKLVDYKINSTGSPTTEDKDLLELAKEYKKDEPLDTDKFVRNTLRPPGYVMNGELFDKTKDGRRAAIKELMRKKQANYYQSSAIDIAKKRITHV